MCTKPNLPRAFIKPVRQKPLKATAPLLGKAIVAIARKLLRLIYKIIKGTRTYAEYGADYFIERLQQRLAQKRTNTAQET
jgi:hypothetical protein